MMKFCTGAFLALTLILSGCSDGGSKQKREFVADCVQSGGNKSICSCTFESLEKTYSPDEMLDLSQILMTPYGQSDANRARAEEFVNRMLESSLQCAGKPNKSTSNAKLEDGIWNAIDSANNNPNTHESIRNAIATVDGNVKKTEEENVARHQAQEIAEQEVIARRQAQVAIQVVNSVKLFNGDLLGTNQRYFESVVGIPRESFGNEHIFRVQGCDITATIVDGNVSALRLELTDACQADLTTFIGDYAPPPGHTLTAGTFTASSGTALSYSADCLYSCGNAYDPSVYAHWQGPRAADFMEVVLEVVLVSDDAIEASSTWKEHMANTMGEDYILDTRFNCDNRFDPAANQIFKDVKVTAITVGHQLKTPAC